MNKEEFKKRYNEFLKKENLSNQEAWVGSGGTLLLLGIREETRDIDLGVSKDIFNRIRKKGLPEHIFGKDTIVIEYDNVIDIHLDHGDEEHTIIDGVGSWTIEEVIKLKKKLNRPKDQVDLKNIEEYISKEQLSNFLDIQTKVVQKNTTIVSNDDIGQDYMLHISHKNMEGKRYQPWIGTRQAPSEDRTVPRITVSPYLIGCIHGFGNALNSFMYMGHKGIFYIHKIPFKHCLKPTNRLVFDADLTDEHWLVRYNPETTFYHPKLVGKFVITSVQLDPNGKNDKFNINLIFDQVTEDFSILPEVPCKLGKSELEFQYEVYTKDLLLNKNYKLKKSNSTLSLENQKSNPLIYLNW